MKNWCIIILLLAGCHGQQTANQIISADTIVIDDGTRVRYAGVEAPVQTSRWYEIARQANAYLVENKTVKWLSEPRLSSPEEQVAYVYTPILVAGEEKYLFVNAELVRFGFVKAQIIPTECKYRELWESLWQFQENEARPQKRNIWSQGDNR